MITLAACANITVILLITNKYCTKDFSVITVLIMVTRAMPAQIPNNVISVMIIENMLRYYVQEIYLNSYGFNHVS